MGLTVSDFYWRKRVITLLVLKVLFLPVQKPHHFLKNRKLVLSLTLGPHRKSDKVMLANPVIVQVI
jgi:hypothetical protein